MSDRKRILFVDDEARILEGLRRMLRVMRGQWDMMFTGSAAEALQELETRPYDVIVSDMRMPGMHGADLLESVKRKYPRMVRIALSGQTSKEEVLRTVGPVHQYLPKPCDADTLKATITRVCSFRDILVNPRLQGLITQLESLPCISSFYTELIEELHSEDASVQKVSRIISQDIGMTVKVLQMVNSAFFGVRQHVQSLAQAVTLLGLETIRSLAITAKIFSCFEPVSLQNFSIHSLWQHCVEIGEHAKRIARLEEVDDLIADHALLSGMLHDVGKLILATQLPEEYDQTIAAAREQRVPLFEMERERIGATHAEVGAYLLGLWGFKEPIIETLVYHHTPQASPYKVFSVLTAVCTANQLSQENSPPSHPPMEKLYIQYLEELRLSDRLPFWREACRGKSPVSC